ncbi:MAG: ROK family transcriptional regulator [Bullifex sp.]
MEFSRPDTAREINRYRVLNALKAEPGLTRAALSSRLSLNKVSMSEIVQGFISEGIITEGEKVKTATGRPGTTLFLCPEAMTVLGADISTYTFSLSLFNGDGRQLRSERYPMSEITSPEMLKEKFTSVIGRMIKLSGARPRGMVVSINGEIKENRISGSFHPFLNGISFTELFSDYPFPVEAVNSTKSSAEAERACFSEDADRMMVVSWGEHITSAMIMKDRTVINPLFSHLPVTEKNLCHCGAIGCLETVASGWGIRNLSGKDKSVRQLLKNGDDIEDLLMNASVLLGKALVYALFMASPKGFIITGGLAGLDDKYLTVLMDTFTRHLPPRLRETPVYVSSLKEKSSLSGCGIIALDRFFYHERLLKTLNF